MFNTPPVFAIYALTETLNWLKSIGGVPEIYRRNQEKAALLYDEIDRNPLFRGYGRPKEDRSLMNICFVMAEGYEELAPEFLEFAKSQGMVGIKGHRLVGGFRASCYNALPKESVEALVACMQEFARKHGEIGHVSDDRSLHIRGEKREHDIYFTSLLKDYESIGCNREAVR